MSAAFSAIMIVSTLAFAVLRSRALVVIGFDSTIQ
jgi:hypothetical protein